MFASLYPYPTRRKNTFLIHPQSLDSGTSNRGFTDHNRAFFVPFKMLNPLLLTWIEKGH